MNLCEYIRYCFSHTIYYFMDCVMTTEEQYETDEPIVELEKVIVEQPNNQTQTINIISETSTNNENNVNDILWDILTVDEYI